jgi:hypothetical protein
VVWVRSKVRRRTGQRTLVAAVTASDLLARPAPVAVPSAVADEAAIPAGMLADLHHPRLIITDDYVGPDRRALDRRELRAQRREERRYRAWRPGSDLSTGRAPGTRAGTLRAGHLWAAVAFTAITVAPVTLVASHLAGANAPAPAPHATVPSDHRPTPR